MSVEKTMNSVNLISTFNYLYYKIYDNYLDVLIVFI